MSTDLQQKAENAQTWLTTGERQSTDTGRHITVVRDEAGTDVDAHWVKRLVYDAHDDGDGQGPMSPDDWRYEFVDEALAALREYEDEDHARDALEPSIYHSELHRWLASHGWRAGYCDEAAEEWGAVGGVNERIARGQLWEMWRVLDRVRAFLDALDLDECEPFAAEAQAQGGQQ